MKFEDRSNRNWVSTIHFQRSRLTFLVVICLCIQITHSKACDACGCAMINGMGLMTNYRVSTLSMGYYTAHFRGDPNHGTGSVDHFQIAELNLRYYISDRFKLLVALPYKYNTREVTELRHVVPGLSDLRLQAGYTILRDVPLGGDTKLFFETSLGAQLPTGSYDPRIHEKDLPENFNPGFGSWGLLQQNTLILSRMYMGIIAGSNILVNNKSSSGYHYGNQISGQIQAYWEKRFTGSFTVTPNLSMGFEKVHLDTYATKLPVENTGGRGTFLSGGINVRVNSLLIGCAISHPITQKYSGGEVDAGNRISAQILYNFTTKGL